MATMTRAERLAQAEVRAQARLDAQKRQLAQVHARRHAEEQKALRKRRMQVGTVVEQSGLFVLDDTTLAALFQALARVVNTPNPAALVEGLLCGVGGALADSLAMAAPTGAVVSALRTELENRH
jgi:hypothetical protein